MIDNEYFSKWYLDGMTAREWTQWASELNQKVNRKTICDDNYNKHPTEIFSDVRHIKYTDRFKAMALPYVMAMGNIDYYDGHEDSWLAGKPVGGV